MEKQVEMLPLDIRRIEAKGLRTDRHRKLSTFERVLERLVQALPQSTAVDVNDLKKRGLAEGLALFYIVFYLSVLLYLLATGTQSEQSREYLSIIAPKASTAICKQIPVPATGTFLADSSGRWSTDPGYDPTMPIYSLALSGTEVTDDQFAAVMRNFSTQIRSLGKKMLKYDVMRSRIVWAFSSIGDQNAKMTLRPNALFQQMFLMVFPIGHPGLASVRGVCSPGATQEYDYPTSRIQIDFPYDPVPTPTPTTDPTWTWDANHPPVYHPPFSVGQPTTMPTQTPSQSSHSGSSSPVVYEFCPDQLSVKNKTFGLGGTQESNTANFDIITLALAYALNFGIADTTFLSKKYSSLNGKTRGDAWVHESYPDMRPVICSTIVGKHRVCTGLGEGATGQPTFVYPVFTSTTMGESCRACQCPRDLQDYDCNGGVGQPNTGEIVQIQLLFKTVQSNAADDDDPYLASLQRLQQIIADDPINGPDKVQNLVSGLGINAFFNSYDPANIEKWKNGGKYNGYMSFDEFRGKFSTLGESVSIMSVTQSFFGPLNSEGVSLVKLSSSSFNITEPRAPPGSNPVSFKGIMCQDSLYREEALKRMAQTPPVKLVQPYLSCHATPFQAFITSAGLAAANAALLTTIVLSLAISTAVLYFNQFHRDQKIIPPARKALMRDETEEQLLSNEERLFAENRTLWAEIANLKALLHHNPAPAGVYPPPLAPSPYAPSPSGLGMQDSIVDRHSFGGAYERQTTRTSHENPSYHRFHAPHPVPQRLSSNEGLQQAIFNQEPRLSSASDPRRLSRGSINNSR